MSGQFKIVYKWRHTEGHIVSDEFNNQPYITANSEDEAIKIFSESEHVCAKYVKRNLNGWHYGEFDPFAVNHNKVIAVPV